MIDTGRCIACHTIERQPDTPIGLNGWIFGCDACQNACPWNDCTPQHRNPSFDPLFDPGRWMPPHGGSSTRKPSPNGSAERRSCAAVYSGS